MKREGIIDADDPLYDQLMDSDLIASSQDISQSEDLPPTPEQIKEEEAKLKLEIKRLELQKAENGLTLDVISEETEYDGSFISF